MPTTHTGAAAQETSSHDLEELHIENLHLRQRLARELERIAELESEKTLDESEKETIQERMFNQLTDEADARRNRSYSNPTPPSHVTSPRRGSVEVVVEPKWVRKELRVLLMCTWFFFLHSH